jgi:hypothetical protein
MRLFRTADESRDTKAAGRHGFNGTPQESPLSNRLRQYYWTPGDANLGHNGRHHGMHSSDWIHVHIIPLLQKP